MIGSATAATSASSRSAPRGTRGRSRSTSNAIPKIQTATMNALAGRTANAKPTTALPAISGHAARPPRHIVTQAAAARSSSVSDRLSVRLSGV